MRLKLHALLLARHVYRMYSLTFEESINGGGRIDPLLKLLTIQYALHHNDTTCYTRKRGGSNPCQVLEPKLVRNAKKDKIPFYCVHDVELKPQNRYLHGLLCHIYFVVETNFSKFPEVSFKISFLENVGHFFLSRQQNILVENFLCTIICL